MLKGQSSQSSGGERRQITALFCDLVDSTQLSQHIDPEDLHSILEGFREECMNAARAANGKIGGFSGDGVLVYFGYPTAHEDAPRFAISTGLEIVQRISKLNERFSLALDKQLQIRIGIHTGIMFANDTGADEGPEAAEIVGDVPNVAYRVQGMAEPNSIVISANTQPLVSGYFDLETMGSVELKGVSVPIELFRVVSSRDVPNKLSIRLHKVVSPLVNRTSELRILEETWKNTTEGQGRCIVLIGEGGIGKSRLIRVLRKKLSAQGNANILSLYGSAEHKNEGFFPIFDGIARLSALNMPDATHNTPAQLHELLSEAEFDGSDLANSLSQFLTKEPKQTSETRDSWELRQKLVSDLIQFILSLAEQKPLLVILEDAHWVDPSTMELFGRLIAEISSRQIMIAISSREPIAMLAGTLAVEVALDPLTRDDSRRLCLQVADEETLVTDAVDAIVARADGNPLFIEEVTRVFLDAADKESHYESGTSGFRVPATLRDSLMARLDKLGPEKELAQVAAVFGRSFDRAGLSAILGWDELEIDQALESLLAAGLIFRVIRDPSSDYRFKHALVRDVAYLSLPKPRRRELHKVALDFLRKMPSDRSSCSPLVLARHASRAGLAKIAATYWLQAAQLSLNGSSNLEAIANLRHALEEAEKLPEGQERDQLELAAQTALLGPLFATKGFVASEVETASDRALELCHKLNDTQRLFPLLYARWVSRQTAGDVYSALSLAQEFLSRARRESHDDAILVGLRLSGFSLFLSGRPAEAREHLEAALHQYQSERHRDLVYFYGTDVRVMALCSLALVCCAECRGGEASRLIERALVEAKELNHAHTLGYALSFAHFVKLNTAQFDEAETISETIFDFAKERNMPFWEVLADECLGIVGIMQGHAAEAVNRLERGLAIHAETGDNFAEPFKLVFLAKAYAMLGRQDEALTALQSAEEAVETGGELWAQPEVIRAKADLLAAGRAADPAAIEALYCSCIEQAREQGFKSHELRGALSHAKFLGATGRPREAAQVLMQAAEGLDPAADSKEAEMARAIIEGLSS